MLLTVCVVVRRPDVAGEADDAQHQQLRQHLRSIHANDQETINPETKLRVVMQDAHADCTSAGSAAAPALLAVQAAPAQHPAVKP